MTSREGDSRRLAPHISSARGRTVRQIDTVWSAVRTALAHALSRNPRARRDINIPLTWSFVRRRATPRLVFSRVARTPPLARAQVAYSERLEAEAKAKALARGQAAESKRLESEAKAKAKSAGPEYRDYPAEARASERFSAGWWI